MRGRGDEKQESWLLIKERGEPAATASPTEAKPVAKAPLASRESRGVGGAHDEAVGAGEVGH